MLKIVLNIIFYLSQVGSFFPLVLSFKKARYYERVMTTIHRYLLVMSFFSIVANALWFFKINNLPLLHFYTIVEFGWIAWFYHLLFRNWLPARLFPILIGGFTALALANGLFIQSLYKFNTVPRSIECILIIFFSLFCYYKVLKEETTTRETAAFLWVNTGFFIYFSAAFSLFTLSNYILPLNHQLNKLIWTVHAFFSILEYTFIFIGIWNYPTRK